MIQHNRGKIFCPQKKKTPRKKNITNGRVSTFKMTPTGSMKDDEDSIGKNSPKSDSEISINIPTNIFDALPSVQRTRTDVAQHEKDQKIMDNFVTFGGTQFDDYSDEEKTYKMQTQEEISKHIALQLAGSFEDLTKLDNSKKRCKGPDQ